MADVSVEFGAKDVGLEKSLQQIQSEMANLQGKVKSGDLSLEELERTMKRIGQVENLEKRLKAMGDESASASPKVDSLGREIGDVGNKLTKLGDQSGISFGKLAGATAVGQLAVEAFGKVVDTVFAAARRVIQSFGDALDLGGRLNELSARTGETAGKLLVLEQAFRSSGLGADQVGTAINKLQNFMADAAAGGEKQTAVMQKLGITLADLEGKTPTQQMGIFAKAISGIEDPTQRAAAASEVFGEKLGGRLLPLLKDFSPNLEDASRKVGSLAQVMDENAATFDAAGETIDAIKAKLTAFAAGILSETIPAVQDLGTALEQVDAAGLGRKIGQALTPILEDFKWVIKDAQTAIDILSESEQGLQKDTGTLGKTYDLVYGSFASFNQILIDTLKTLTPFDSSLEALEKSGLGVKRSQDQAAAAIAKTNQTVSETTQNFQSALPLVGEFNANLRDANPSFTGLGEQTSLVKDDFSQIAGFSAQLVSLTNEQAQSLGGVIEQTQLSKQLNEQIIPLVEKMNQLEADRLARLQESQDKTREQYQLELQIAEAKARGDEETVKTLENQKLYNQELEKAIKAGFDNNEKLSNGATSAGAMAQRMVDAKNAAGDAAKNAASFASWADYIAGTHPEKPMKSARDKAIEARQEVEAFGRYIGEDLSQMPFPDVAEKLGIDAIGPTGTFQIDEVLKHLEKKRQDLEGIVPVDDAGSKTKIDELGTYLGETLKKSVDLAVSTGEGSKILGDISGFVETIKGFVETIKERLPQQALA